MYVGQLLHSQFGAYLLKFVDGGGETGQYNKAVVHNQGVNSSEDGGDM